jgi:hypothetical protein
MSAESTLADPIESTPNSLSTSAAAFSLFCTK